MAVGPVAVLIALLLGASNRYLTRFQRPYSFEAQSEPTVEIVDAPIILDIVAKPAVRNQGGRDTRPGKNSNAGTQVSNVTATSTIPENSTRFSTAQWSQGNGPPGGPVRNIFATPDGTVYRSMDISHHTARQWEHVSDDTSSTSEYDYCER